MSNRSRGFAFIGGLLILTLVPLACSDFGDTINSDVGRLSGSWRWISSIGGLGPHVISPQPGDTVIDSYSIHGDFSREMNHALVMTAHFSLSEENSNLMVIYTNVQYHLGYQTDLLNALVHFEGDTLRLMDYAADMYRHTYVRMR
jgi:hypothetical protein